MVEMPSDHDEPRIVRYQGRIIRIFDVPPRTTQIMGWGRPKRDEAADKGDS